MSASLREVSSLGPHAPELRVLRPRRASPDKTVRPTRAEVDLSALRHNLRAIRREIGAAQIYAVLKADGYGHGAPAVARTLERAGCDAIAVALLEEAIELREAGIRAPILVMGGYYGGAYDELLARELVPVVYDPSHFEGLARALSALGNDQLRAKVHLKIDTGMSRLGVRPRDLPALLEHARAYPQIEIDGVMTHLACADVAGEEGEHSVAEQLARFYPALAEIRAAGHRPSIVHAANSAAMLRVEGARFGAVRPGIALFGVDPCPVASRGEAPIQLAQTLRVRTEIVSLRTLEVGESVGYGSTWRASRRSVIATVPLGYADGLPRNLSGGAVAGAMLVRGKRAPIVGAISMDLSTLDVTDIAGARLRDEVVSLGEQRGPLGSDAITIDEVSRLSGLIPWDVMTSISRRVPRFYRGV